MKTSKSIVSDIAVSEEDRSIGFITRDQLNLPLVFSWVKKSGFAILDQGLFSGANFLVNILLARWLESAQYGAFSVAYSVFLLLAAVHNALIIEPMMVFGAGKYAGNLQKYLGTIVFGHWRLTGAIALSLGLGAITFWCVGFVDIAKALGGLAAASPFLLLLWLIRKAFYIRLQPGWAAIGSALYLLLAIAGVNALYWEEWLSSLSALLVMALSSLLVSSLLTVPLGISLKLLGSEPIRKATCQDHWRYGRWLVATAGAFWLFSDAIVPVIAVSVGIEATGVFRAFQNLILPIYLFLNALSTLMLPYTSSLYRDSDNRALRRAILGFTLLAISSAGIYAWIISMFGEFITSVVLGSHYVAYKELLGIWCLVPVIFATGHGLQILVRLKMKSGLIFFSYIMGIIATAVGYVVLVPSLELQGVVWTRVLGAVIQSSSFLFIVYKYGEMRKAYD
jgi:O-antigen/teichoic acid export membrane protein